jgi:hypothetical protein
VGTTSRFPRNQARLYSFPTFLHFYRGGFDVVKEIVERSLQRCPLSMAFRYPFTLRAKARNAFMTSDRMTIVGRALRN